MLCVVVFVGFSAGDMGFSGILENGADLGSLNMGNWGGMGFWKVHGGHGFDRNLVFSCFLVFGWIMAAVLLISFWNLCLLLQCYGSWNTWCL